MTEKPAFGRKESSLYALRLSKFRAKPLHFGGGGKQAENGCFFMFRLIFMMSLSWENLSLPHSGFEVK
jgi:hypothetical protein